MNHFSKETLKFLEEVRRRNSKQWYEENKAKYHQVVVEPLKHLVNQLAETMKEIDPEINTEPRVGRVISRLHRDTRFSKDKSLYKDTVWLNFARRNESKTDFPSYFFLITPYSFSYGMGFYCATVSTMNDFRELIDKEGATFGKIIVDLDQQALFQLEGELYKRSKYTGDDEKIRRWYDRKNVYMIYESIGVSELFQEGLIEELKEGYLSLKPLYEFFLKSIEAKGREL